MKKTILILFVAAVCSVSYSQTPDTLKLPFYEEDINLPLGISRQETIKILEVDPTGKEDNFIYFHRPLNYNSETINSSIHIFFSENDELKYIQIATPLIENSEQYKKTFDFFYSLVTNKLGEKTNGYQISTQDVYYVQESSSQDFFNDIINYQGEFSFFWDIDQLTYKLHGYQFEDDNNALIYLEISKYYDNDILK